MITAYYRPSNKDQALSLLDRPGIKSICICGSTRFNFDGDTDPVEAIDLQNIGLTDIHIKNEHLIIEGLTPLNKIIEDTQIPDAIKKAILHDFANNQRNSTPVAGALFNADGISTLATVLLACDTQITLLSEKNKIRFGDWILIKRKTNNAIIEKIEIAPEVIVEYLSINKSPASPSMMIVAVARWKTNRIRITLGGEAFATSHLVLDGVSEDNYILAIQNSCSQHTTNKKLTPYFKETAKTLLSRLISNENFNTKKEKEGV